MLCSLFFSHNFCFVVVTQMMLHNETLVMITTIWYMYYLISFFGFCLSVLSYSYLPPARQHFHLSTEISQYLPQWLPTLIQIHVYLGSLVISCMPMIYNHNFNATELCPVYVIIWHPTTNATSLLIFSSVLP